MNLIAAENLYKCFSINKKNKKPEYAVRKVSLGIERGEIVGLVGESGCGKTTLGKLLLKLEEASSGSIIFNGEDITHYSFNQMRPARKHIQMIFQGTTSSFNPYFNVAKILSEPLNNYEPGLSKEQKERRIIEMLCRVGLDESYLSRRPHQMSGGQRQRVGIARSLIVNPDFVVCDEAVSSVDYAIKNRILDLLKELQQEYNAAYLFISHDVSAVKRICSRVVVMYLGNIVEVTRDITNGASHPYTQALLASALSIDPEQRKETRVLFRDDEGMEIPERGCVFQNRCIYTEAKCKELEPELAQNGAGHFVACHRCKPV